ncbi:MAG: DUF11 domain-containing protein [Nannocystaceae bacterium]|nr:DUF11 domain-containing protein [Nannocystaceae bacterium]
MVRFARLTPLFALLGTALTSSIAAADDFAAGSLIIPMDTTWQDAGMLRAYGLVYELLRQGVPVRWAIRSDKLVGEEDFTASGLDVASAAPIMDHGYRGGPWIIDAADADEAMPIVTTWQAVYPETAVHEASDGFEAEVARYLVVAPTIAMHADGNEDIAREYMVAAAIPDSVLDYGWPADSPDMLTPEEVAGPTEDHHADGMLFDEDGDAVYCQFMSMHWGVAQAEANPEVVAEVRQFLNNPTHFFAECQAVSAFENLAPHGFFLTPNGLDFADRPDAVDFYNAGSPFAQLDGPFETVGGSEPAYALPPGDAYKAGGVVMLTGAGMAEGTQDVWMTGYLDGACPPDALECGSVGKVSYLGGHRYATDPPVTMNPDVQGARLFLNALFEAPCATLIGLPVINLAASAPALVIEPEVTFTIAYANAGEVTALEASLVDPLPPGTTFVSASGGGALVGSEVIWDLGNLGPGEGADVSVTVQLDAPGVYDNAVHLDYRIGVNDFSLDSNHTQTVYDPDGMLDTGADQTTAPASSSGGDGNGTTLESDGGTLPSDDSTTAVTTASGDSGSATAGAGTQSSGCGCTAQPRGGVAWLALLALPLLRRRRALGVLVAAACSSESPPADLDTGSSGIGNGTDDATSLSTSASADGPKLDAMPAEDVFSPQTGCAKIDFLFVIDSSESMTVHQTNLVQSFPGFVQAMRDAVPAEDWHVMVVDTDAQWNGGECANACTTLGTCPGEPAFACDTPPPALCDIAIGAGMTAPYGTAASNSVCALSPDERFIGSDETDLESTFTCIATVGVDGNSEERTADALVAALSPEGAAATCNAGFLRDDAILVVTIITDEADLDSSGTPALWYDAVVSAKQGDPAAVVVLGLLPDADTDAPLCDSDAVGGTVAQLLDMFPAHQRASVCEPDYGPALADSIGIIADTCEQFVPPG